MYGSIGQKHMENNQLFTLIIFLLIDIFSNIFYIISFYDEDARINIVILNAALKGTVMQII